jgi:chromosome segregation ATPase
MSKKAKTPTDNIKRELFGGLSRTEVEKLLDNAAKEQARLTVRLESAQAELTRAQNEFEARTAAEAMLRSQVDHLREDSERLRLALEGEIQELREALARHQSDNYSGDQSDLLAQIERLRYELETANARLEEMVLLQAEVESLRHQLANATTESNSHYSGNTGEGDSQLLEEIERLQRELNAVPDLNEQIAVLQSKLMASEEGAELERANAEIERLTA